MMAKCHGIWRPQACETLNPKGPEPGFRFHGSWSTEGRLQARAACFIPDISGGSMGFNRGFTRVVWGWMRVL